MTAKAFIICAPSGTGKTTIARAWIEKEKSLVLSISHTTRKPRPAESNGKDYHFVSEETFKRLEREGVFLETAEVYGNFYGTSKNWIQGKISEGFNILLEIDVQGAAQVRDELPNTVSIFILPPSLGELRSRLIQRNQDSEEVIARRLAALKRELAHINSFDYAIINQNLDDAVAELASILKSEGLKVSSQGTTITKILAQN